VGLCNLFCCSFSLDRYSFYLDPPILLVSFLCLEIYVHLSLLKLIPKWLRGLNVVTDFVFLVFLKKILFHFKKVSTKTQTIQINLIDLFNFQVHLV